MGPLSYLLFSFGNILFTVSLHCGEKKSVVELLLQSGSAIFLFHFRGIVLPIP